MSATRSEKVSFEGALGATLDARLERPVGELRAVALFAHCFTCSKNNLAATHPKKSSELRAKLAAWQKQLKAKMPVPNPNYQAPAVKP